MIPCFICGKDASTGWSKGFVPAPDSQKLALCAGHDTPENRARVDESWNRMQQGNLAAFTTVARQKAAPAMRVATVHFTGGGMLSFTCMAVTPTEHGTLRIEQPDGGQTFIPMRHIREYAVRPFAPEE